MAVLDNAAITEQLASLDGWTLEGDQITKTYQADTFNRAVAFVVQVAMLADVADHHPDIDIRYNRVTLSLSTHSEGGITDKDFALASQCESAF